MLFKLIKKIRRRYGVYKALHSAHDDTNHCLNSLNVSRVLVLCYGNIYRSPFVAEFLRDNINQNIQIQSAGFYHKEGRPSPEKHVTMAKEYGVDLRKHRSKKINAQMIQWADIIIIMDRHNWYDLSLFGKYATQKAVWLGALQGDASPEINDPYGESSEQTRILVERLLASSKILIGRLKTAASMNHH